MSDRDDPRKFEHLLSRGFGWLDQLDRPQPSASDGVSPFADRAGTHKRVKGGDQWTFKFANGYGASVVRHSFSYGSEDGLWELAVLGTDGRLTYETPITDDVIGWQSDDDIVRLLGEIEALDTAS